jgi:putative ABC transport system permease protein
MGIPLRRGRVFAENDRAGAPAVAVVNSTLARRFFGVTDPIGERVRTAFEGDKGWVTIVGEVGDVRGHGLAADPVPELYRPLGQFAVESMTLMVRGAADPARLAGSVRQALAGVDPSVIIDEVRPMRDVVEESVANPRHVTLLLLGFGLLALALAAIGVFAVVAFAVAQRTRELGIRVALGASRRAIITLVLRQGALFAGAGVVLGSLLALAGGGVVRSQLYLVPPDDPAIYAVAFGTLLAVALLATYLPARRAARVDPMVALRNE